ncbi:peptide-methionine (R)-S-oxide reductase MsrB [Candidatus Pacearchaeota archaeon]|nr:peptide-methionine (R)-S-oxide reductase MsrB [Candidatus Pacearchaeota archaeon]
MKKELKKNEDYWHEKLSPEQFYVMRKKGTERPFSGSLLYNKKKGNYVCGACGNPLFESKTKFDSGTGWPSFYDARKNSIKLKRDFRMIIPRTEVFCARCGSHLGHVFNHPKNRECPSGKRYCINSIALGFRENKR